MMHEPARMDLPLIMLDLLQGIQHKARMGVLLTHQPTIRRAYVSMKKATQIHSLQVATQITSDAHGACGRVW